MVVDRIAVLSTYMPRQCGIAIFADDLAEAISCTSPDTAIVIAAINDGQTYSYPPRVSLTLEQNDLPAYEAAAIKLNTLDVDVLSVQHEFGIFGGPDGSYLLALLRHVRAPIVTTLHTVLETFTPKQCAVIEELGVLSARIVVMSERAVRFLVAQGVAREKIVFIHHGIPDVSTDRDVAKERLGLSGRPLILTFGLLSPNKGIETVIHALPGVVRDRPELTYLVLGATHPRIRKQHGEAYREKLERLAAKLGVAEHVRFENKFVDADELTGYIAAADIYLTPYLNREQITSGTLAYALGNGKAVVSTPFWYAEELLAGDRGVLVPFRDPGALSTVLGELLGHTDRRRAMEDRARAYGEQMRWPNVARTYVNLFETTRRARVVPVPSPLHLPALTLDHVAALTDETGVLQHAVVAVPNFFEGYTTDDNARALQLTVLAGDDPQAPAIARRALSFLHYAFNPASRRFHNFMAYDRHWLDEDGGENTQARAVRALVAAAHGLQGALGSTARELLSRSWPALNGLNSPRAQAIALIALAEHAQHEGPESVWMALAHKYAGNLLRLYSEVAMPTWQWFEVYLSYSNAKLAHGLIAYGRAFKRPHAVSTGLKALHWLELQQTAPDGAFLPVGSERPYRMGEARPLWDGQPIEVYATVAATLEAHRAAGDVTWLAAARRALEWLFGRNALKTPLYDSRTGGCHDGLHRDRLNANEGAESTLALWLSAAEYSQAVRLAALPSVSNR
jgi:glycosyltransferase involved in cell wall biosynthesis